MASLPAIINYFSTAEKMIAFTFDDGPNPHYTPMVLDIFREVGGKATFFMIGNQLKNAPEIAQEVHKQGHEIGNHSFTHPNLTELNKEACYDELIQTEKVIEEIIGVKPQVLRPPFFGYNDTVAEIAAELNYKVIGAVNGAATDWEMPGVQHIVEKTRESLIPGCILLFHDGFGDRSQTIEAVRQLVSELHQQGYMFVTVSELSDLSKGSK